MRLWRTRLPDLSQEHATRLSSTARTFLDRLGQIDPEELSHAEWACSSVEWFITAKKPRA